MTATFELEPPPSRNNPHRSVESVRTVAIAGNPNSGKSTLFNALTGLRQKVGNYPGVTVEKKIGRFRGSHGEPLDLLDLPGTYSLQTRSPDEAIARDALLGRLADTPQPDVILCVVDATNLERNLYLVAQMAELGLPLVVGLNMIDLAEGNGMAIHAARLSKGLGCPVIPCVASQSKGLVELRQAITRQLDGQAPHRAPLPKPLEEAALTLGEVLVREQELDPRFALAEALLLITATGHAVANLSGNPRALLERARQTVNEAGLDRLSAAIHARYAWVHQLAAEAVTSRTGDGASISDRLDAWLTHKIWGWVFFLGVMTLMFFMVFQLAEIPMDWIQAGQTGLINWVQSVMPAGDFRDLLTSGIISGVGTVVTFLPQILILFFFIGLLEDTGYLARAAFIIDRLMSRVGLHGKSFVPMLSSFACAIPGIMATRTIDNPKDRLATILVAPLVSCPARLPVYSLMIAVLLPMGFSSWDKAGIMLAMYLFSIIAAFGMAWVFRKTLFKGERSLFLLEMPPYRRPSLGVTVQRMWERSVVFLRRAGTIILSVSVIIWALSTYPKPANPDATPAQALAGSAAGKLGHIFEPLIKPLGYDWKVGVGIISSFAAREVFVGTMSVMYSVQNGDENLPALRKAMLAEKHPNGAPVFTPLVCIGLMVYYVLAMQCLSTVAVVRRETNSWKWPLFQIGYMSLLAWAGAFLVFQIGHLFGFS
ncbi:MAG TPA: ferrous iron transport protein B [Alphaproteobacteria bacterium]|nr:ferrous iron transport protein B [Alphaproteobacteria bacterium]